jgi:hypothetical protein
MYSAQYKRRRSFTVKSSVGELRPKSNNLLEPEPEPNSGSGFFLYIKDLKKSY